MLLPSLFYFWGKVGAQVGVKVGVIDGIGHFYLSKMKVKMLGTPYGSKISSLSKFDLIIKIKDFELV